MVEACRIINCFNCKRSGVQNTFHLFHECNERLYACIFNKDDSIALADWICLSHIPPMWPATGGFLCHLIQSPPSLFQMKITVSVTKSSHQDYGCAVYTYLFFSYTSTLLFCCEIKSYCDCYFPQKIRPQMTVQLYVA